MDHMGGIAYHAAMRHLKNMRPPTYVVSFRSPAILRNAEGEASATTVHDRPEVLRTVFTAEALGADGWEYLDDKEDEVLVLETSVQVNTAAAESKSAEKPAPTHPSALTSLQRIPTIPHGATTALP
jgi:hypothetical protein